MKTSSFQALRGTKDILPEEAFCWQALEQRAHNLFTRYNYKEIRTPVLEELGLFVRSVGKTTDIVQKEIFAFMDRGRRRLCLRPEATASCVRAYLEHAVYLNEPLAKFYYIGPMFRAERPQAGRLRQFHQIGVEVMGSESYFLDAEIIALCINLVKEFGLTRYLLRINSLGCAKDKENISDRYRKLLNKKRKELCPACRQRLNRNVLRILDCKEHGCQKIIRDLPSSLELICPGCKSHFEKLLALLDSVKIGYKIDTHIVRGLDYYTRTVFELTSEFLGSQDALGAGGRYDNLIESLGGPSAGAIGFALGMERVILALRNSGSLKQDMRPPDILMISLGEEAAREGFVLLEDLRKKGFISDIDCTDKSLKAKMRRADKLQARFALLIGEDELRKGEYILRDMSSSQQSSVRKENLLDELSKRLK